MALGVDFQQRVEVAFVFGCAFLVFELGGIGKADLVVLGYLIVDAQTDVVVEETA